MKLDLDDLKKTMLSSGLTVRKKTPHLKSDNAKELFTLFFKETAPTFKWLPEYDEIVEWLTDNESRSLLMTGDVGRGKTVIGMDVIPKYFLHRHRKMVNYFKAIELNTRTDEVMSKFLVSIDDIGFEGYRNNYGQKQVVFLDLLNRMEQDGALTIVSTNLTSKELLDVYGVRGIDRINALFKIVRFEGESFRK